VLKTKNDFLTFQFVDRSKSGLFPVFEDADLNSEGVYFRALLFSTKIAPDLFRILSRQNFLNVGENRLISL